MCIQSMASSHAWRVSASISAILGRGGQRHNTAFIYDLSVARPASALLDSYVTLSFPINVAVTHVNAQGIDAPVSVVQPDGPLPIGPPHSVVLHFGQSWSQWDDGRRRMDYDWANADDASSFNSNNEARPPVQVQLQGTFDATASADDAPPGADAVAPTILPVSGVCESAAERTKSLARLQLLYRPQPPPNPPSPAPESPPPRPLPPRPPSPSTPIPSPRPPPPPPLRFDNGGGSKAAVRRKGRGYPALSYMDNGAGAEPARHAHVQQPAPAPPMPLARLKTLLKNLASPPPSPLSLRAADGQASHALEVGGMGGAAFAFSASLMVGFVLLALAHRRRSGGAHTSTAFAAGLGVCLRSAVRLGASVCECLGCVGVCERLGTREGRLLARVLRRLATDEPGGSREAQRSPRRGAARLPRRLARRLGGHAPLGDAMPESHQQEVLEEASEEESEEDKGEDKEEEAKGENEEEQTQQREDGASGVEVVKDKEEEAAVAAESEAAATNPTIPPTAASSSSSCCALDMTQATRPSAELAGAYYL